MYKFLYTVMAEKEMYRLPLLLLPDKSLLLQFLHSIQDPHLVTF